MLFTIGTAISAAMLIYGGYLAIVYALVPESTIATADDELPEIGYYVKW
jgi:hypothetical protein